jgi:hypothetical protein
VSTFGAQAADRGGELGGAGRGLAEPERDVGRLAGGVLDADAALSTRRIRQGCCRAGRCRRRTLSMAKSSSTVPTTCFVGSATTV